MGFEGCREAAKKTRLKINAARDTDERVKLFQKQMKPLVECVNQASNAIRKPVHVNGELKI
jgi:hypothetical protein